MASPIVTAIKVESHLFPIHSASPISIAVTAPITKLGAIPIMHPTKITIIVIHPIRLKISGDWAEPIITTTNLVNRL
jgi:hypothetical protein